VFQCQVLDTKTDNIRQNMECAVVSELCKIFTNIGMLQFTHKSIAYLELVTFYGIHTVGYIAT
jgi:hypothetical protein